MNEIRERLPTIHRLVVAAWDAVKVDRHSSNALVATVEEFLRKSQKALHLAEVADDSALWEIVVELEQAGDSAKAAVLAEKGIGSETRKAVLDAHQIICQLKISLAPARSA